MKETRSGSSDTDTTMQESSLSNPDLKQMNTTSQKSTSSAFEDGYSSPVRPPPVCNDGARIKTPTVS